MKTKYRNKALMWAALFIVILFAGSIYGGSGHIEIESVEWVSYMEKYGTHPIESSMMELNYTDVSYSTIGIRFLERFTSFH